MLIQNNEILTLKGNSMEIYIIWPEYVEIIFLEIFLK